ncbi:circadian clock KaiB family protein [Altericista sp. CCNU0014]|uniref:circadian clock KaiB family protein n=1 Tax=Altericista sp. CCNU0014 TaxID=3082949 RepID=UPI00384DDD7A
MGLSYPSFPETFKGLALFTPGGDAIYCIDPAKQGHWHIHLCSAVAQVLSLPEAPLFLTHCFTATVDRWIDPKTQTLKIAAEVKPRVWQYRPLLQSLFNTPLDRWQIGEDTESHCTADLLERYRQQFPQLWEPHNLVLNLEHLASFRSAIAPDLSNTLSGYVLRLFINGKTKSTIQALESLHQFLEQTLTCPYTLRIVDVRQHPEVAERDGIAATPTLIKTWPPPVRRIVGTLDKRDRILRLLDLA